MSSLVRDVSISYCLYIEDIVLLWVGNMLNG